MFRKTVPDDWSGNAELSSVAVLSTAQISTFCRKETGSATEIQRRYADVLEICRTGTSDTAECKKCNFKLYPLRYRHSQCRTSCSTSVTWQARTCHIQSFHVGHVSQNRTFGVAGWRNKLFPGWMPFLSSNQCQNTKENSPSPSVSTDHYPDRFF